MKKVFPLFFLLSIILTAPELKGASPFLSETANKSPLKKSETSVAHELQNTFHNIYNQYKDSVPWAKAFQPAGCS